MTIEELQKTDGDGTRERILEAAEEVFADKGFKQATVREILKRAEVGNIAAINYHFGDKERLYVETVKNAHSCCNAVPFPAWPAGTPAEQKLRDFIRVVAERMLVPLRVSAIKVVVREMTDPTIAFAEVVREYIEPMAATLRGILSEMLPHLPPERIYMIGNSIVGQCLFYRQNRPVIEQLMGKDALDRVTPDVLAEHVTNFTLAAIQQFSSTGKSSEVTP
jgi:AcrR family transcriptional regulator